MKITMLYFFTIGGLIEKYGYSWHDVDSIQDHGGRVRRSYIWDGREHGYTESLQQAFYAAHMGRTFDENVKGDKVLVQAFLEALEETRAGSQAVAE